MILEARNVKIIKLFIKHFFDLVSSHLNPIFSCFCSALKSTLCTSVSCCEVFLKDSSCIKVLSEIDSANLTAEPDLN